MAIAVIKRIRAGVGGTVVNNNTQQRGIIKSAERGYSRKIAVGQYFLLCSDPNYAKLTHKAGQ